MEKGKTPLFTIEKSWKKEWQGMPEFIQEDINPIRSITIHFLTSENVESFAKLIDQKITKDTKYLYFPKEKRISRNKIYVDEK